MYNYREILWVEAYEEMPIKLQPYTKKKPIGNGIFGVGEVIFPKEG